MSALKENFDIIVVGAGIVGLTIARELAHRKAGKILVLEKEPAVGKHASGRNSGVIHAGIYYPADSNKAKFCVGGARQLIQYAEEHNLPMEKCGKVIVATRPENVKTLATLLDRAKLNGVEAKKINLQELKELEPNAKSYDYAIWSPNTAIIDSKAVLECLYKELERLGVKIEFNQEVQSVDIESKTVRTNSNTWHFNKLCNAAGVYADKVAHAFGVGKKYRILPFKGLYWKSSPEFAKTIRRLIYPAPDVNMPFLGVHITKTVDGKVLFGPTAIPAFGRENYSLLGGLSPLESPIIAWNLLKMIVRNPNNVRNYVREELARYVPKNFYNESKTLVHQLERKDIADFYKVGIRAQLMDTETGKFEMDFKIEKGPHSLHVLNAVSPAFTSALGFAPYVADLLEI